MFKNTSLRFSFSLGLLFLILILTACNGSSTAGTVVSQFETYTPSEPSATTIPPTASATDQKVEPEVTPTLSPTSTVEKPSLTPTPSPTPRGALTWEQESRLYQTSLTFLADNHEDATVVVRDQIDYLLSDGEDPSLACGPISAVILRDAGLLPPDADIHGFWLLDPRTRSSQIVLETHFPKNRFEWYQFETGTHQFDFNAFPLLPGDFIYLYAGINGTFEHIITVTRVDEAGRAYTVSNLATEDGFVIRELMLYDPNNPGEGQFYAWMNREINGMLGMTGDGGFDLWRPNAPAQDFGTP
jgi:hypothetical protein